MLIALFTVPLKWPNNERPLVQLRTAVWPVAGPRAGRSTGFLTPARTTRSYERAPVKPLAL